MIIIIGASASGKTEMSKLLVKNFGYKKLITTTTRQIREQEVNHIDYHFISKESFLNSINNNEFVEYALYNNNYYGINKKDVESNALVIVEPKGANELIKMLNNKAFVVYVEADQSIRKDRMMKRGDDPRVIIERLQNDFEIFKPENLLKINLMVENNYHNLEELTNEIHLSYIQYKEKAHLD